MRHRGPPRRRGFMSEAWNRGRQAAGHVDHFLRAYAGPFKQFAQMAAPALASAGYAPAGAALAAGAQAVDGYAQLRQQLGD